MCLFVAVAFESWSLCDVGICCFRIEMTTEDRPRRPRERRYVIVSKDTVRQHAESVGIAELSDEILEALAEDVSYRVRDVIQVLVPRAVDSLLSASFTRTVLL